MQTTTQSKMHSKEISQTDWKAYFNKVTKSLANRAVSVEVTGFNVGDEMLAEGIMLQGLSYDGKNHLMEVSSENVHHLIHSPERIFVSYEGGNIDSVEIIDSDESQHIIRFLHPLALGEKR